jgi:hypothetical protein
VLVQQVAELLRCRICAFHLAERHRRSPIGSIPGPLIARSVPPRGSVSASGILPNEAKCPRSPPLAP